MQIVKLSLELLSYDPNYNYESDDEDEGMDTDELEQDELYGFTAGYSKHNSGKTICFVNAC